MITDNQWHDGIIYRLTGDDTRFVIVDTIDEAKSDQRPKECFDTGGIRYQGIKYNWNHGQPKVDFGDFSLSIVDPEMKKDEV